MTKRDRPLAADVTERLAEQAEAPYPDEAPPVPAAEPDTTTAEEAPTAEDATTGSSQVPAVAGAEQPPAPVPPAAPVAPPGTPDAQAPPGAPDGVPFPGLLIARNVADDAVNGVLLSVDDPLLRHELLWTREVVRAAIEMTAFHADRRAFGEAGPQLAPMTVIQAGASAFQRIVDNRRAATDNGERGTAG